MDRVLNAKLTYEDYASAPADGMTYQILDGELLVTPAPSPFHQRASKRLQRQLEAFFEDTGVGEVFNAPIDLILSAHDILQPDLVVVTDPTIISSRGIEAPPLLVTGAAATRRPQGGLCTHRWDGAKASSLRRQCPAHRRHAHRNVTQLGTVGCHRQATLRAPLPATRRRGVLRRR